jgi:oligosaccharyltransferase complex subunit beta
MRSFTLGLLLGLLSFVSALSAAGSNLLVVVDDEADKGKYSTFWSDLTCKQHCRITAIA